LYKFGLMLDLIAIALSFPFLSVLLHVLFK
jgi:hypothetical protein